jgi:hypothetical protein
MVNGLNRGQTLYLRLLRNQVLELNVDSARERGDRVTEIHCSMLLEQWKLVDDGYDFITDANAKLARDFRARMWYGIAIAVSGLGLFGIKLIGFLV